MFRLIFLLILAVFVIRSLMLLWGGVRQGLRGQTGNPRVPQRGVSMVRDPVCGTFIVPERALSLSDGSRQIFFCSITCRDKYRAGAA